MTLHEWLLNAPGIKKQTDLSYYFEFESFPCHGQIIVMPDRYDLLIRPVNIKHDIGKGKGTAVTLQFKRDVIPAASSAANEIDYKSIAFQLASMLDDIWLITQQAMNPDKYDSPLFHLVEKKKFESEQWFHNHHGKIILRQEYDRIQREQIDFNELIARKLSN
jgi:hypothetical protein